MAKSYEPDPRRFRRTLITAMIFLTIIALVVIHKKNQKYKENPPAEARPY